MWNHQKATPLKKKIHRNLFGVLLLELRLHPGQHITLKRRWFPSEIKKNFLSVYLITPSTLVKVSRQVILVDRNIFLSPTELPVLAFLITEKQKSFHPSLYLIPINIFQNIDINLTASPTVNLRHLNGSRRNLSTCNPAHLITRNCEKMIRSIRVSGIEFQSRSRQSLLTRYLRNRILIKNNWKLKWQTPRDSFTPAAPRIPPLFTRKSIVR